MVEGIDNTTKVLSSVLGIGPSHIIEVELKKEDMLEGEPCTLKIAGAKLGSIIIELLQTIEGSLYGLTSSKLKTK